MYLSLASGRKYPMLNPLLSMEMRKQKTTSNSDLTIRPRRIPYRDCCGKKLIPQGSLIILEFILLFQGVGAVEMKNNPLGVDFEEKRHEKALPFDRAFRFSSPAVCLAGDYVGRTWAFFALSDLELDLLTFLK